MRKQKTAHWLATVATSLLCLSFLYPLYYMFINSLKDKTAYYTNMFNLPVGEHLALSNYTNMITQFNILRLFKNTAFIVVISVAVIIILGIFASFAFAKLHFRGRMLLYGVIIATIFMPGQVTIIPLYISFSKLGLTNNAWSVILPSIASSLPGTILMMVAFFRGIPDELLEACEIDGANFIKRVRNIVVPIGLPAIVINIISTSIGLWNDFFLPMIMIQRLSEQTVMVALASLVQQYSADPTFQMCGLLLATLPALLIYVMLQKHIVNGITAGALK